MKLKCISVYQPFASLLVGGVKHTETRSWPIFWRGRLIVVASKKWSEDQMRFSAKNASSVEKAGFTIGKQRNDRALAGWSLPLGAIVGTIDVIGCVPTAQVVFNGDRATMLDANDGRSAMASVPPADQWLGNFAPGRFAWILANAVRFKRPIPYPVKGNGGISDVHAAYVEAVQEKLAAA